MSGQLEIPGCGERWLLDEADVLDDPSLDVDWLPRLRQPRPATGPPRRTLRRPITNLKPIDLYEPKETR